MTLKTKIKKAFFLCLFDHISSAVTYTHLHIDKYI